jgi:hypothetical protein
MVPPMSGRCTRSYCPKVGRLRALVVAVAAAVLATGLAACQPSAPYEAAVFGDVPYSDSAVARYLEMIGDINAGTFSFASHLGDFKDSDSACTETRLLAETSRFDTFDDPLVYTPGDNEWTDCDDALFWLGRIREVVFRGTGTLSRGRAPMALASQAAAGYPENARWSREAVTFATVHVVGGGDESGTAEGRARRTADIAWVRAAFAAARVAGHRGVVLLAQDSPFNKDGTVSTAYRTLMEALRDETVAFGGQVLWIQGDGHTFLDDRPMKTAGGAPVSTFRRVQVEGDSKISYVRMRVDPGSDPLFTITRSRSY